MKTETIKVKGMSCNHCKGSVNNILSRINGVVKAEVSLEDGSATIEFDPGKVDLKEILDRINDSHYKASMN